MAHIKVTDKAAPGSDEWLRLITGSKIAAIMGLSRWETPYSLWHTMKGHRPAEDKEIYRVGHYLEDAIRNWYLGEREHKGLEYWSLSPQEVQYTNTDLPFPNAATMDAQASRGRARRVFEAKTVRQWEEWGDVHGDRLPADYWAQLQWNMGVSGFTNYPAHLVAMGPFFDFRIYEVPFDRAWFDKAVDTAARFVTSLDLDVEPPFTAEPVDYTVVKEMHPDIHAGEAVDVDPGLVNEFIDTKATADTAKKNHDRAKATVAHALGSAEFATVDGERRLKRARSGRGIAIKEIA